MQLWSFWREFHLLEGVHYLGGEQHHQVQGSEGVRGVVVGVSIRQHPVLVRH